jgi:hypothetical protein
MEELDPAIVFEHYEESNQVRRSQAVDVDRVVFESRSPRTVWLAGVQRISLRQPEWRPMPRHEVEQLIGRGEV